MRKRGGGQKFWNKSYSRRKGAERLTLSTEPSEDLQKFTRWVERQEGHTQLNPRGSVLDLGCGNGRNLMFMAREFGMRGVGYDTSSEAIKQARAASAGLPIQYEVRSIAEPILLPDNSQTLVLDMMTSHFLREKERAALRQEIFRVLRPGGWLFLKTFMLEEDEHAVRLLREHPADEPGSYIHPEIGVYEHVSTESEIEQAYGELFEVHKTYASHKHRRRGKAFKRRSISVYVQKRY